MAKKKNKPMGDLVSDGRAPMADVGTFAERPKILEDFNDKQKLIIQSRQMQALKKGDDILSKLPKGVQDSIESKERIMEAVNQGKSTDPKDIKEKYLINDVPLTRARAQIVRNERLKKFGIESDLKLSRIQQNTLGISITKKDIIDRVASIIKDVDENTIKKVINLMFAEMKLELINGNELNLVGFGSFSLNVIKAHDGYNPKTGEKIHIEKMTIVKFKPSKQMKDKIVNECNKKNNHKK